MKYRLMFFTIIFSINAININTQMIEQPKEFFQGFFIPEDFNNLKTRLEILAHAKHPNASIQLVAEIDLDTYFKNKSNSEKDIIDVISTNKGCMLTNHHLFAKCFSRPELSNNYKFIEFGCFEEINGIFKHRFQEWENNAPSDLSILFDNPRKYLESTSNFLNIQESESIYLDVLPRLAIDYLGISYLTDTILIKRYQIIDYDSKEYDWF